jgi:hypothetical protein
MFEEESGMPMWGEWRTNVSQRSLEIIVHGNCAFEADAQKNVSTLLPRPKLWKHRCQPIEKIKKTNPLYVLNRVTVHHLEAVTVYAAYGPISNTLTLLKQSIKAHC